MGEGSLVRRFLGLRVRVKRLQGKVRNSRGFTAHDMGACRRKVVGAPPRDMWGI